MRSTATGQGKQHTMSHTPDGASAPASSVPRRRRRFQIEPPPIDPALRKRRIKIAQATNLIGRTKCSVQWRAARTEAIGLIPKPTSRHGSRRPANGSLTKARCRNGARVSPGSRAGGTRRIGAQDNRHCKGACYDHDREAADRDRDTAARACRVASTESDMRGRCMRCGAEIGEACPEMQK
jgi:hypothetical protein